MKDHIKHTGIWFYHAPNKIIGHAWGKQGKFWCKLNKHSWGKVTPNSHYWYYHYSRTCKNCGRVEKSYYSYTGWEQVSG